MTIRRSTLRVDDDVLHIEMTKVDGRWLVTGLNAPQGFHANLLRRISIGQLEAIANAPHFAAPPAAIDRPTGENIDAYYRNVATRYTQLVQSTQSPAPVIAAEAGVPVGTVHRWIRDARRRGYLPPARQGRAG